MENPSFTGPPKFLQDIIFFNIRIPIEGLPTGIFLTRQEDQHDKGFHRSSAVFTSRGLGPADFEMSGVLNIPWNNFIHLYLFFNLFFYNELVMHNSILCLKNLENSYLVGHHCASGCLVTSQHQTTSWHSIFPLFNLSTVAHTSAMFICTEAWSLALMRRLLAELQQKH